MEERGSPQRGRVSRRDRTTVHDSVTPKQSRVPTAKGDQGTAPLCSPADFKTLFPPYSSQLTPAPFKALLPRVPSDPGDQERPVLSGDSYRAPGTYSREPQPWAPDTTFQALVKDMESRKV